MQYTFDGECLGTIEPTGDDLADEMSPWLGDEMPGCTTIAQD